MKAIQIRPLTYRTAGAILLITLFSILPGCRFYYKVQTVRPVSPREIRALDSLGKYLVLHHQDSAWHLSNPLIARDTLSGLLSALPDYRRKYRTTRIDGSNRYIRKFDPSETYVLEEVHLYLSDSMIQWPDTAYIRIPLPEVQQAEVYVRDKGRTAASWLIPVAGGLVVAGGVAVLTVALVNESWGNIGNITH